MHTSRKKWKHYVHFPFSIKVDNCSADVNSEGKVTLTKDADNDEYDEITTSASIIFALDRLLEHENLKVVIEKGRAIIIENHPDGTFDEIAVNHEFLARLVRTLIANRKVETKDEPFQEKP